MRVAIAREGMPFVAGLAAVSLAVVPWAPWVAAVPAALAVFTLWFFRDPERRPPEEPGVIVAPADGRVVRAEGRRVSIFLNILDVHVCRSPVTARVLSVTRTPGRFLAAFREEASEHNERTAIDLQSGNDRLRLTLVAGLVARRIVSRVREGDEVQVGARVGLIRFGSRVDLDLPPGASLAVAVGERVMAGESVVARAPSGSAAPTVPR